MATELYREFAFTSGSFARMANALRMYWSNAVEPLVAGGKNVRVIISSEEAKRNNAQNARYFGFVLKHITEQAWVSGQQFDQKVWHEYVGEKFGVMEDVTLPDGRMVTRRKSTTEMSVREFAEYMTKVEVFAAQELGVMFPV